MCLQVLNTPLAECPVRHPFDVSFPFHPLGQEARPGVSESPARTVTHACTCMYTHAHRHIPGNVHVYTHLVTNTCTWAYMPRNTHAHVYTSRRGRSRAGLHHTAADMHPLPNQTGLFWARTGLRDWAQGPSANSGKSQICGGSPYQMGVPDLTWPARKNTAAARPVLPLGGRAHLSRVLLAHPLPPPPAPCLELGQNFVHLGVRSCVTQTFPKSWSH